MVNITFYDCEKETVNDLDDEFGVEDDNNSEFEVNGVTLYDIEKETVNDLDLDEGLM